MARTPNYPTFKPDAPEPRNKTIGWWGIGSVAAGVLGLAFLPAAMMGANWVAELANVTPLWGLCCLIGIATGIRGMQRQRRATKFQRLTAFFGTIISLITFVVLVIITVVLAN